MPNPERGKYREHLRDEEFIRGYWWMKKAADGTVVADDCCEVYFRGSEGQGQGKPKHKIYVPPIAWEFLRRHPFIGAWRRELCRVFECADATALWNRPEIRERFVLLGLKLEILLICFGQLPWEPDRFRADSCDERDARMKEPLKNLRLRNHWKKTFERHLVEVLYGERRTVAKEDLICNVTAEALAAALRLKKKAGVARDRLVDDGTQMIDVLFEKPGMASQLERLMRKYTSSGYRFALLAVHPSLGKRDDSLHKLPALILKTLEHTPRNPRFRFSPGQLTCVFQFESPSRGHSASISTKDAAAYEEYRRSMGRFKMPISWRKKSPERIRVLLKKLSRGFGLTIPETPH